MDLFDVFPVGESRCIAKMEGANLEEQRGIGKDHYSGGGNHVCVHATKYVVSTLSIVLKTG